MPVVINEAAERFGMRRIAAGDVDTTSDWEMTADDENELLGDPPDWDAYAQWHLGTDTGAPEETKARHKYPFGKGGKVYRSALIAIRSRSAQQDEGRIFAAAGRMIEAIDGEEEDEIDNASSMPTWAKRQSGTGYEIRSEAGANPEILLYGPIGSYFWDEFSAHEMERRINELGTVKNINLRINSPGGDLFEAIAIFNMLKRHPADVTVYIDGLAASAATVIAMAGDRVIMPKNAQMMIHNASTGRWGDYRAFESTAKQLRKANTSAIETYAEKAKNIDKSEMARMMDDETWLTAEEAVELGLADAIERESEIRQAWDLSCYRNAPRQFVEHRASRQREIRADEFERRNFVVDDIRVTASANGEKRIVGHAAVFNKDSEYMGFVERVAAGAFRKSLQNDDVRALFNHDPNYVLGRNRAGTLSLSEDGIGLKIEITPPDTQYARDLMISMERGDINQMSFGFICDRDSWDHSGNVAVRTLQEVTLMDVSPVTFAAYPDTDVAVRSMNKWSSGTKANNKEDTRWRDELDDMRRRLELSAA